MVNTFYWALEFTLRMISWRAFIPILIFRCPTPTWNQTCSHIKAWDTKFYICEKTLVCGWHLSSNWIFWSIYKRKHTNIKMNCVSPCFKSCYFCSKQNLVMHIAVVLQHSHCLCCPGMLDCYFGTVRHPVLIPSEFHWYHRIKSRI